MRLPAALLLGAIGAAILVSWFEGRVRIPPWAFVVAQGFVGCLVARSITPDILLTIFQKWPMFLFLIGSVILMAAGLGFALARWKVLPGSTAVWGSSPGAATAMVLMADAYGGDIRLVAVMQYLRVACVGLVASIVARAFSASSGAAASIDWFPPLAAGPFLGTLALAFGGAVVGLKSRMPAGPLLLPLFVGAPLSAAHMLTITLPPWLLALCYALVGWSIGLRFTREIVLYAAKQLPRILASIFALIALCGALAFASARGGGNGRAHRLSRHQPRRRGCGGDHRRVVPGRCSLRDGDADRTPADRDPDRPQPRPDNRPLDRRTLNRRTRTFRSPNESRPAMLSLPWYIYLLQFVSGLLLANGVPHFVQGICGRWFQTPFASPPGVGESSPLVNVLWGFLNLAAGFALLFAFSPKGSDVIAEWSLVALGALIMALALARHFGRVRSGLR